MQFLSPMTFLIGIFPKKEAIDRFLILEYYSLYCGRKK